MANESSSQFSGDEAIRFPIDQLPKEMVFEVFSHLGVKTLPTCRLVSKRWKWFVDHVKLQELVVSNKLKREFFDCGYQWRETNDGFKWVHSIRYNNRDNILFNFDLCRRKIPFDFSTLKRLSLQHTVDGPEFKFINSLASLEHLEIYSVFLNQSLTLSSDRLRVLRIMYVFPLDYSAHSNKLYINAPRLEVIAYRFGLANWHLSNPESVKQLQLSGWPSCSLKQFRNVEKVRVDHPTLISGELLNLPKLRELRLIRDSYGCFKYFPPKEIFQSRLHLRQPSDQKARFFCFGEELFA